MRNGDLFGMAVRNLFKHKLRAFITVLGVVVGVISIVLMISFGVGVNMNFDKQMEGMGDLTVIQIYSWDAYYGNPGSSAFDDDMIKQMSGWEGVKVVTPILQFNLKLISGRHSANVNVMGMKPEALEALGYELESGEYIDPNSKDYEIVFGVNPPYSFLTDLDRRRQNASNSGRRYGYVMVSESGMGSESEEREPPKIDLMTSRIKGSYYWSYGNKDEEYPNGKVPDAYTFVAVGMLKKDEMHYETSEYCFMDIQKAQKIRKDQQKYEQSAYGVSSQKTFGYEMGYIKCNKIDDVQGVMDKLEEYGFQYYNPTSWIQQMRETAESLQILLAAIGAVAFFVAALGIANTMIMSMYERTKEIGIMKVIGASLRDIRLLFLLESALIGFLGGIIGLGLSYAASALINNIGISFMQAIVYIPQEDTVISYIPVWLSVSALVFSAAVGLIAGYFPARRAMRIPALKAIKTE